jgi:protein-serine/threonine kinase
MPYIPPPRGRKNHLNLSIRTNAHDRNTQTNLLSADTTFTSGLRRIRSSQVSLASLVDGQQAVSDTSSHSPHPMSISQHILTSSEDLTKFPSQSLHSFSFSQPRDPNAILESRQNVLRKSIDYMKDKLYGMTSRKPWTDEQRCALPVDIYDRDKDVLESLKRAKLIPEYWDETNLPPPTAPAEVLLDPFEAIDAAAEPLTMPNRKTRTPTDLAGYRLQAKVFDAVTKPYSASTSVAVSPTLWSTDRRMSINLPPSSTGQISGVVPIHSATRLAPNMQAIFSTEACAPWKILNANDLACLEFDVNEQEIKRGISILECFEFGRRDWVEERLAGGSPPSDVSSDTANADFPIDIPAKDESVVLCGEVVRMRKIKDETDGKQTTFAASLWVKEKVHPINSAC